jgi:hypothetical protein
MEHEPDVSSRAARRVFEFAGWAAELFHQLHYTVQKEIRIAGVGVDLLITRDEQSIPVEVSTSASLAVIRQKAARLHSIREVAPSYARPILITLAVMKGETKDWIEGALGIVLWDQATLYEVAKPFEPLVRRLSAFLGSESTADGEQPSDQANKQPSDQANALIRRLTDHEERGDISSADYEALCLEVMAFLFDPDLHGFAPQAKTTDGANRYDFICRIQSGNRFWDSVRSDFRTRSILFECKNYAEPITADQIYSTERYLFSVALRTVCFLISRKGPDESCKRAAQGALRESGKLILLFSNRDLVQMIKLRNDQEDGATGYLDEKIWQFITTLPR